MKWPILLPLSLLLFACSGEEDGEPAKPKVVPQQALNEFFSSKRHPKKWTFKGVSVVGESATVSFGIEKGFDEDFAKKEDYYQISEVRSMCPREAELDRIGVPNMAITVTVSGTGGQKFPKVLCP